MYIDVDKIELMIGEMGLTKVEIAEKGGLSSGHITKILQAGRCEPRTAGKLAKGLDVSLEDIILCRRGSDGDA